MRLEAPTRQRFVTLAEECGFALAGIAPARPIREYSFYQQWVASGLAGEMEYLTDHRGRLREDPRNLLPSARSVLCLGKLYNTGQESAPVSRYAWGLDYHDLLGRDLNLLVSRLRQTWGEFDARICVDTAPLLERSLAQAAGLGWIGKNTCLINQERGSWFFLGEILISLELAADTPPPERCGSCTRCISACPTQALIPVSRIEGPPGWQLDARLCISYLTIELPGSIPEQLRTEMGDHLFGCDICQDVCPWNTGSPIAPDDEFQPRHAHPDAAESAALTAEEFREKYRKSPLWRSKHRGFLRNLAVVLGNRRQTGDRSALELLAAHDDPLVREHAEWALRQYCA